MTWISIHRHVAALVDSEGLSTEKSISTLGYVVVTNQNRRPHVSAPDAFTWG